MSTEDDTPDRRDDGTFATGRPAGPGRPKGAIVTKRKKAGEEMARAIIESRWTDLVDRFLSSEDDKVALQCFTFLFDHAYGRAKQRAEIDHTDRQVRIQFDVGKARNFSITDDRGSALDAEVVEPVEGGASPLLQAAEDVGGSDSVP